MHKFVQLSLLAIVALYTVQPVLCTEAEDKRAAAIRLYNEGGDLYRIGQSDKALEKYNKAIETDPTFAHVYLNRSGLKQDLHDYPGALADLDKLLELMPCPEGFNDRSLVKQQTGDYQGSLKDINEAIKLRPGEMSYYINRSITREFLGDLDGARADADKAVSFNPKNSIALQRKSTVGKLSTKSVNVINNYTDAPDARVTPSPKKD